MTMFRTTAVWTLLLLSLTHATDYLHEFRSPFSPGTIMHGMGGNPALLSTQPPPAGGLQLITLLPIMTQISNNKLLIPDPVELLYKDATINRWIGQMILESFDAEGASGERLGGAISDWLNEGIDLRAVMEIPLLRIGYKDLFKPHRPGWGVELVTCGEAMAHIPGKSFAAFFTPSEVAAVGDTIPYTNFVAEVEFATELRAAYSRATTLRLPFKRLKEVGLNWGVGLTYRMGHGMLMVPTDEGQLIYADSNFINLGGRSRIITAGVPINDDFTFGNPLENGFPASGHGGGISAGVVLSHEDLALSVYVHDVGIMVWNGVRESTVDLHGDSLDITNVVASSQRVGFSGAAFEDQEPLIAPLMTRLQLELSYRWNPRFLQGRDFEPWSQYRLLTLGYRQPLVAKFGLRAKPVFSLGLENGFVRGNLPVRVNWTFGGWEKVTSGIEYEIIADDLTYVLWYRSIGDGLFRPRKGVEIGLNLQILWGSNR